MTKQHDLELGDILPMAEYGKIRADKRRELSELKRFRRVEVGPYVTFYFESYETMWGQVHEMLFIEKAPPEQAADEIGAYNPLIPKGRELIATFMIEIDDPVRRKRVLDELGGVENTAFLSVGGTRVNGIAEADQDRTTPEGKASSVQFVHFPFTEEQIAAFRVQNSEIILGLSHKAYSHMAVLPEAVRASLAEDFD
ncbi:MAG: DUF3501 family protein [Beijerinckiaceae bacterium]